MASELQVDTTTGWTLYALIRGQSNNLGLIWNGATWESYNSSNLANYGITLAEQGTSSYYAGTFPATIPAGTYSVVIKRRVGGSPAESDPTVVRGNFDWNGTYPAPLSDMATSGQVGQSSPLRLARGTQILNFGIKLVSSSNHSEPFTSGVISGQIARDGGTFGALQSGAITEVGYGWYNLQALTSGDLLCNTAKLMFTGVGVSGGTADQRDFFLILQRTSGV